MPYLDGTGPMGRGPMTGRGLGYCGAGAGRMAGAGFGWPGMGYGRGFGRALGFGAGFGWRAAVNGAYLSAVPTVDAQKNALEYAQKALELRLEAVKAELDALKKSENETPNA